MDLEKVIEILWKKSEEKMDIFLYYLLCVFMLIFAALVMILLTVDGIMWFLEYITVWN